MGDVDCLFVNHVKIYSEKDLKGTLVLYKSNKGFKSTFNFPSWNEDYGLCVLCHSSSLAFFPFPIQPIPPIQALVNGNPFVLFDEDPMVQGQWSLWLEEIV